MSKTFRYHPYYCEENVWHLCRQLRLADDKVQAVFVTNHARQVPTAWMRATDQAGGLVVWDYHVFALAANTGVWDLDCVLGCPLPLEDYLQACFSMDLPGLYQPLFRPIPADLYLENFASDRGHMQREDGSWYHPPPPWPAIRPERGNHLTEILDLQNPTWGPVFNLWGLNKTSASSPR